MGFSLEDLNVRIAARAGDAPDNSYTASLLAEGVEKCARKFGEEAVETVISTVSGDKPASIGEVADVLYHLLVLLKASDIELSQVMDELERRTAQSGLEEKASR